ncbi:MAG: YncE family protein [Candidatus Obscuribacter sp.]|nr:YncE family protein [Candidatus Obscuribacter sp.]
MRGSNRIVSLCFCLIVCTGLGFSPAFATRMPANLTASLKTYLPSAKIRLDGAIVLTSGELYLPILPVGYTSSNPGNLKVAGVVQSKGTDPDLILLENGMVFARVLKKPGFRTILPLAGLEEKYKKAILAGKMPSDLIVPEEFVLSPDFKPIIGDLGITISGDKKSASPASIPKHGLGGVYITSPASGSIILVDQKTNKKIAEFPTEGTPLGMVQIENNLSIADQTKSRVLIFNTAARDFAGRQIDLPPKSAPKAVAAIPNGRLLYVTESATGLVDCVETESGRVLLKTKVPPGPSRLVMTPNGNSVLVLNVPTGQVSIISTMNQKLIATINVGASPNSIVVSADNKYAYVSCKSSNHIVIIDIVKRMALAGIKTGNGPTGLALSSDGKVLYLACAKDNTITAFDTATKNKLKEVKLPMDVDFPGAISLDEAGKRLYVTSNATDTIGILNLDTFVFEQAVIGRKSDDVLYAKSH